MIGASKKGLPVFVASLAVVSAAFAGQDDMKPNACKGPSLCHTRPNVDSNNFMIDVGFLVEQARLTGTMYGYTLTGNAQQGDNAQSVVGNRPKFGLDWGVTVGVGRHFEHDDWDVLVHFDWISSTGKNSTATEFGEIFVPVNLRSYEAFNGTGNVLSAENASSVMKINYYMLDAVLGRGSFLGGCHHITPHLGFKAAWINYKNTVKLTGGDVQTGNVYWLQKNDKFWGVGPDVGVDAVFGMAEGLGIFVDNSAAILLGYSSVNDHSWSSVNANAYTMLYKENSIPVMSPTLKMYLGLQYERPVYYGCQHIRARLGWDTAFYFNQYLNSYIVNEVPTTNARFHTDENNTFSLTGLRFDVCWDF